MENESAETTPEHPSTRALKRKSERDNIVETIGRLNRWIEPKVDLGKLSQLSGLSDEDWKATMARIARNINAGLSGDEAADYAVRFTNCPGCGEALEAPAPEVAVANLATWQKARPVFFPWSPYELRKLLEHLHQHSGHVPLPDFAQSVTIREPSGRMYTYLRDGKVK
jgi:hypothetical protein